MAIVMTEDSIYTASRDKSLKRWKVGKNASGRFELSADLEVPLGDLCWSMVMVGEWIFCGLADGTIKGFSKSGQQAVLTAHTKRAACLLVHMHVLISGGSDGTVRLWQADPSGNFVCTNTITEGIASAVNCLAVLNEHLWVGGTSGVSVVELSSLRVVHQIQPKKFVAGFQMFEGHMIVAYADGNLCIFDGSGVKKHDMPPLDVGPILAIAGLESGPRLLCGHAKGQVSSIILPQFQVKKSWQALEKCKVHSLCCAGQDGVFLVGAENGNIQVWQRSDAFVQM
jgi:WD40 repeat protein